MPLAENIIERLLAARNVSGFWEGQLSSSALSTATAMIALARSADDADLVRHGAEWLQRHQNTDGGWGDTVLSKSNISTTALCWAALPNGPVAARAEDWLRRCAGSTAAKPLSKAITARYGKDQTFSVPILTALAIGGRLQGPDDPWAQVPQLPFELAAFPHRFFQWLQLPVVSYALPALIAIGLVRHGKRPSRNLVLRRTRDGITIRVLQILEHIQPSSGGFLEATPLTSFVAMSLLEAGFAHHAVTERCLRFLRASARPDGSWPIDTNLSTWLTTLSINAMGNGSGMLTSDECEHLTNWLLAQQLAVEHPYTHAAPGAWAWTNLPGGVPDADDTAGAILALRNLGSTHAEVSRAARRGIQWLVNLQNRDGGMPTFCRGWGHLPFDRSGADLTAHALRAWNAWLPDLPELEAQTVRRAARNAVAYLLRQQEADGSWVPLWFGNEHAPNDQNRTFGTARVVTALCEIGGEDEAVAAGVRWLRNAQNADGGWGGCHGVESSIEETSLAIIALASAAPSDPAVYAGMEWLTARTAEGTRFPPQPIGFYFASLWYFEDLYPLVFAAGAAIRSGALQFSKPAQLR